MGRRTISRNVVAPCSPLGTRRYVDLLLQRLPVFQRCRVFDAMMSELAISISSPSLSLSAPVIIVGNNGRGDDLERTARSISESSFHKAETVQPTFVREILLERRYVSVRFCCLDWSGAAQCSFDRTLRHRRLGGEREGLQDKGAAENSPGSSIVT